MLMGRVNSHVRQMDLSTIIVLVVAVVMVAAVMILFRLFAPRPPKR